MESVIGTVINYINPHKVRLSDFVDQCCCGYTPLLLAIFMFITGTIDTFGKPINCWIPAEFPDFWASFVHQYCYVTGTYTKVYEPGGAFTAVYVDYYQWVPFMLIIQAIAMRIPHFIWSMGQTTADIDFHHIHAFCANARNEGPEQRVKNVESAAIAIYEVSKRRNYKGLGNTTAYLYILFKLLNIAMVIVQIIFLNSFVGYNNPFWGLTLARNSWYNNNAKTNWQNDFTYFPRVAYCDFSRMDLLGGGFVQRSTRCSIGINILNEKVFIILYFWYYALLAMVVINAVYTILLLVGPYQTRYIDGFLTMVNREDMFGADISRSFAGKDHVFRKILGLDGLLLLRFVHNNAGLLIASELCARLYHIAYKNGSTRTPSVPALTIGIGIGNGNVVAQEKELSKKI